MLALGQWLMVLPATLLLATSALRFLQPRQHEPARTSQVIIAWASAHISQFGALLLLIGLPMVVVVLGWRVLVRTWRGDEVLRRDAIAALSILRRQLIICLLTTATRLAGGILMIAAIHVITD